MQLHTILIALHICKFAHPPTTSPNLRTKIKKYIFYIIHMHIYTIYIKHIYILYIHYIKDTL
jgi:hypothetical protein